MATLSGVPAWIQLAKNNVQRSDDWISFTKLLFDILNSELKNSGIKSFATLTVDEKKVLVSKAVNNLKDEKVYRKLFEALTGDLDLQFSAELKKSAVNEQDGQLSDKIFEEFHLAVEAILAKWPETKAHFGRCVNTLLTQRLRNALWEAKLQSPNVKQEYLNLAKSNPKRMVSKFDLEIAQKCKTLIESDETLEALRDMKQSATILRHVLSYHHRRSRSVSNLTDSEYLVAVPFIYCSLAPKTRQPEVTQPKSLSAEDLAKVVEQFDVFWRNRPNYVKNFDNDISLNNFIKDVIDILKKMNSELVTVITDKYVKSFPTARNNPVDAFKLLLQPCLRCFFVSYLPLESVLFIFDQILIGYEIEGYDPLPYLTAVLLYLIRSDLKAAESWRQIESSFSKKLKQQYSETLQGVMTEKHVGEELIEMLNMCSDKSTMSFTSSTFFNNLPSWKHWYSEKLVDHFQKVLKSKSTPQVSYTSVEKPLSEPENVLIDHKVPHEHEAEREHLIEQMNLMKQELKESKKALYEERLAKLEIEKQSDLELNRLRQKLRSLERTHVLTPPFSLHTGATRIGLTEPEYEESETSSIRGLLPPPPSVSPSVIYQPTAPVSPTPQLRRENSNEYAIIEPDGPPKPPTPPLSGASVVLRDLINRFGQGYNELAHSSGQQRQTLNNQSRQDFANVRKAYELAKTKVIGKPMSDDEIKALSETERKDLSSKLSQATRAQLIKMKVVNT